MTRRLTILSCLSLACTVASDDGDSFSGGSTPSTTASVSLSDGSADGTATTEGSSGTEGTTAPSTTADDATADSTTTATTEPSTSSDSGGDGPPCTNAGDVTVLGATGPANANQNCPTTTYAAVVAAGAEPIADVEVLFSASVATTSELTLSLQSPAGTTVVSPCTLK